MPYNTSISGVMQPICVPLDRKLLDQFRDKMRTLHYALATEKAYRHWIIEFLRFHRDGDVLQRGACGVRSPLDALVVAVRG